MLWYTTVNIGDLLKKVASDHDGLWMSITFLICVTYTNGMVKGLETSALFSLQYTYDVDGDVHMRPDQIESYLNAGAVGSLFACFITTTSLNRLGRRRTIQLALLCNGFLLFVHGFAASAARCIGLRFVIGCLVFVINISTAYYVAEMFPDHSRAFGAGLAASGFHLGLSTINAAGSIRPFRWNIQLFTLSIVCVAVTLVTWFIAEESPRWFIQRGDYKRAESVLKRIHAKLPYQATIHRLTLNYSVPLRHPICLFLLTLLLLQDLFNAQAPIFGIHQAFLKSGLYLQTEKIRSLSHLALATTVLSMSPCYDKLFRMTSLYICMFVMCVISILFVVISSVLMSSDFSSVNDWFLFRSLMVISLLYLVTHAYSVALLPLFLVAEYLPLNDGCSFTVCCVLALSRAYSVLGLDSEDTPRYALFQWLIRGAAGFFLLPIPLPFFVPEATRVPLKLINQELGEIFI